MAMQVSFQNMLEIFSLRLESLLREEFFNFSANHVTRMTQKPRSEIAGVQKEHCVKQNRQVFALSLALLRAKLEQKFGTKLPGVNK